MHFIDPYKSETNVHVYLVNSYLISESSDYLTTLTVESLWTL